MNQLLILRGLNGYFEVKNTELFRSLHKAGWLF